MSTTTSTDHVAFRFIAERSTIGVYRNDVNGHCTFVNSRAAEIVGLTRDQALGTGWAATLHPDDRERVGAVWADCKVHRRVFKEEYRFVHKDGGVRWVIGECIPTFEDDGTFTGFVGSLIDITERKQAEDARALSESRFRTIFEQAAVGVAQVFGETTQFVQINQRLCEILGLSEADALATTVAEVAHADDRLALLDRMEQLATGRIENFTVEMRWCRPDGSLIWVSLTVSPLGTDETPSRCTVAVVEDITARRRAAQTIRGLASGFGGHTGVQFFEAMARQLSEMLDADVVNIGELMATGDRVRKLGLCIDGDLVPEFEYDIAGLPCADVVLGGAQAIASDVGQHLAGHPVLSTLNVESYVGTPLHDAAGKTIGLVCVMFRRPLENPRDTCSILEVYSDRAGAELERLHTEHHQRMLVAELDHRVKNTLAAVLSMAEQTIRTSRDLPDFGDRFVGRIRAMARTHEALAAGHWSGVDLRRVVQLTVGPHIESAPSPVELDGDAIQLPSESVAPIAMTLYELTTNASKYGALANVDGRLEVKWERSAEQLTLHWSEYGVRLETPPKPRGFGLQLIQGLIEHQLGGRADVSFQSDGIRCRIAVPLND